ncbi:MAG: pyridoxal phosphate-dependent aminotransferase [Succinivibrionaceae bacterium]|nr:pyridoxal phosphate-dependent aminotransferase [Succinivibrionaceae bacterium]
MAKEFDFDEIVDRLGTDSLKWGIRDGELPMWVADMDFRTPSAVTEAIIRRAEHGIFGYSVLPKRWYDAYISWWSTRHGFAVDASWLVFSTGVVPSLSSMVRRLTAVGENVLIQTPVYNIFFNSIVNNGRRVLESPLVYEDGAYRIDFDDLERKLSHSETTLMILCNPHNPVGKIWSREELERIGELCFRHHVTVISDEIHCDLTLPGCGYIPFASVSERCREISVTCVAPSKTFNMAGLQSSAVIAPNLFLRQRVSRGLNNDEVAEPNAFAVEAAVAAFGFGAPWLDALRAYLAESRQMVEKFICERVPQVDCVRGEATYLLWLDCRKVTGDSRRLAAYLRSRTGLWISSGEAYGASGAGFLRLNAACPHSVLMDGLERFARGISLFLADGAVENLK